MIKVQPFTFSRSELTTAYKKQQQKIYDEQVASTVRSPANPFSPIDSAPSFNEVWYRTSQNLTREKMQSELTTVKETWINPKNIRQIDVCESDELGKKFLTVMMDNGDKFLIDAASVQEFMLKNVILGEEI